MDLINSLNIDWLDNDDNSFVSKMILSNFHAQPLGIVNGGAILAFAEIISGKASNKIIAPGYFAVGQSITAFHIKGVMAKGSLTARGKLLHAGRKNHIWDINISDECEELVSHITVNNVIVPQNKFEIDRRSIRD